MLDGYINANVKLAYFIDFVSYNCNNVSHINYSCHFVLINFFYKTVDAICRSESQARSS